MLQQFVRNTFGLLDTSKKVEYKTLQKGEYREALRQPPKRVILLILALTAFLAVGIGGCAAAIEGSRGLLSEEHKQTGVNGGEESGDLLTLVETFDTVRGGARLIMNYDASSNSFVGTVENITTSALEQVRVEVHLSDGVELGPTTPVDLLPGQLTEVKLLATSRGFEGWTPHAEVGADEHGTEASEHEGNGEHEGNSG